MLLQAEDMCVRKFQSKAMATLFKADKSHTTFLIYPVFRPSAPTAVVMRCAANVACCSALEVADANVHAQQWPPGDTHTSLMHHCMTALLTSRQAMLYRHVDLGTSLTEPCHMLILHTPNGPALLGET